MLPGRKYRLEDVARAARRRLWLVVVPFAVVSALTAIAARQLPDRFRSETLILVVPQRVPDAYVKSTVTTRIEDRLESISQQILSRTRLERIIRDFNLYPVERSTQIMEDVVERMRRDIVVQVVKGDAFRVSYTGATAPTVMKVTERLASMFIEENLRDREVLAEGTSQFLEAQLEDARRRLIDQEKKIELYRQRFTGQLPSQLQSNLQVIQNIQLQIQALAEALNRDRERRLLVERVLADIAATPAPAAPAPVVRTDSDPPQPTATRAVEQLDQAKAILRAMQVRLKPAHPDLIRAQLLVEELQRKVDMEAAAAPSTAAADDATPAESPTPGTAASTGPDNRAKELRLELEHLTREITRKEQQEQQLRAAVEQYQRRVDAVPSRESELAELTRDYTTLQAMYTSLLTKKEDSKIAANLERRQIGEQFKLLDPARLPEKPYSPNRPMLVGLGMAAGLLVGIALVALAEYHDTTFERDEDVIQALAVPVLAVVPAIGSAAERRRAFLRQVCVSCGLGVLVAASLVLVAYTLVR